MSCYYAWYYQRYDPTMLFVLVKNGIFKEGVSGSINLHTPSLYKCEPTPQKAKELVKNGVSYSCLKFGAQILYNCASARSWEKNSKHTALHQLVSCLTFFGMVASRGSCGPVGSFENLGQTAEAIPSSRPPIISPFVLQAIVTLLAFLHFVTFHVSSRPKLLYFFT